MVILELSVPNKIYDEIRKIWVPATPEEKIRQQWLLKMVHRLGYPRELLCVEKELSQLPHLSLKDSLPERRIDVLCFAKDIHPSHFFYPLLLMEMKVAEVGEDALEQLRGYNYYVQAPFLALVSAQGIRLYHRLQSWDFLPAYKQLLEVIKRQRL